MKKTDAAILDYYDKNVVKMMVDKYAFKPMEALRKFWNSEAYQMLSDAELEMWDFGPEAIFNMWECEQITGNPRDCSYLRADEHE